MKIYIKYPKFPKNPKSLKKENRSRMKKQEKKKKKNKNMTRLPFQHSHSHRHWKKRKVQKKKKKETFSCIKAEIVVVRKWQNYPWKVVVVEYSVVWPGGIVVLPRKFLPGLSQILRVLFVHRILKFVRLAIKKEKKN